MQTYFYEHSTNRHSKKVVESLFIAMNSEYTTLAFMKYSARITRDIQGVIRVICREVAAGLIDNKTIVGFLILLFQRERSFVKTAAFYLQTSSHVNIQRNYYHQTKTRFGINNSNSKKISMFGKSRLRQFASFWNFLE